MNCETKMTIKFQGFVTLPLLGILGMQGRMSKPNMKVRIMTFFM